MSKPLQECPFHSVVVVGAGLAGLSAAFQLQPLCPNLLLLEASDRIGGRVQHVRPPQPPSYAFYHPGQLTDVSSTDSWTAALAC